MIVNAMVLASCSPNPELVFALYTPDVLQQPQVAQGIPALVFMVGGERGVELEQMTDNENEQVAMRVLQTMFGRGRASPLPRPKRTVVVVCIILHPYNV